MARSEDDDPPSRGHWLRFLEVMAVIGVLATVVSAVFAARQDRSTLTAGPPPARETPAAPLTPAAPSLETPQALAPDVGSCLSESLDKIVSCNVEHRYEVVATQSCTPADLAQYLGGRPDLEVLLVAPEVRGLIPDGQACLVDDPSTDASLTSARDVLSGGSGSAWRRCLDARTGRENVPCSEPHTSEFVLTASAASVDCSEIAARYLNAPPLRYKGQLRVDTLQAAAGPQCLVSAQGANLLTSSVRNVGTSTLPLVPA